MRISDWSSDVCSSDLFARSTPDHRNIIHRVLLSTPTSKIAGRMERRPRHQLRTPARYETLAQRGCEYDDRDRYLPTWTRRDIRQIGKASCRERVWQYGYISVVGGSFKTKTNQVIRARNK